MPRFDFLEDEGDGPEEVEEIVKNGTLTLVRREDGTEDWVDNQFLEKD